MTLLSLAALILAPPDAFGCGWWGDGEDDGDNDAIIVGPDGAPTTASEPTDPEGMARLSLAYREGDGVPRDPALARQWAKRAAKAGHAGAMNDLAQMLESGFGGSKDEVVAARWFAHASELGVAKAQHSLAAMLREGRGVERNLDAAEKWLRRSAMQGHRSAALDLSAMIWEGLVTAQLPNEGCFWWIVGSREGKDDATERCRKVQPTLSDEALRVIQTRAAAWVPLREGSNAYSTGGS